MRTEELLSAIDLIQANVGQQCATIGNLLEDVLGTLQHRIPRGSIPTIPASKLLELQTVLPASALLEDMLSAMLVSQLPPGLDGHIIFSEGQPLSVVLSGAKPSRMCDLRSLPFDLISQLLEKKTWSDSTGNTIVALLYSHPTSVQVCASWLNSKRWGRLAIYTFASVLAAFLDCTALTGGDLSQVHDDVLHDLLNRLFLGERYHGARYPQHLECIHKILVLSGTRRAGLMSALQERIQSIPIMDFAFETTFIARKLVGVSGCDALATSIVDRGLQWAVRHLSDDVADSEESNMALENLSGCSRTSVSFITPD